MDQRRGQDGLAVALRICKFSDSPAGPEVLRNESGTPWPDQQKTVWLLAGSMASAKLVFVHYLGRAAQKSVAIDPGPSPDYIISAPKAEARD